MEQQPFDFVEQPSAALHMRLGELATNMRNITYSEARAQQVAREANHILFELECRGEGWGTTHAPQESPKPRDPSVIDYQLPKR